jgi:iron complex outermembrane receptor protein
MHRTRRIWTCSIFRKILTPGTLGVLMLCGRLPAADQPSSPRAGDTSQIRIVQNTQPPTAPGTQPPPATPGTQPPPVTPGTQPAPGAPGTQPAPVPSPTPDTGGAGAVPLPANLFGTPGGGAASLPAGSAPGRVEAASQIGSNVVSGGQAPLVSATDVGDLLRKSDSATGVETQRRSPIANETRIRGEHLGQILTYADGAFWFPARQDLDTFLSKIDSGSVRDLVLLKGPYSARYGPGFSFIDIETLGSYRSTTGGFDLHGTTMMNYQTAGEQLYGRQSIYGGDETWGFRASYGHRTGNDYHAGDGEDIPASYNARDFNFNIGVDPTANSRLEFGYMRLDQTGLEFPGQIFDTQVLLTDAYRARFTLENQPYFDRFQLDGWYNHTSVHGEAQGTGKRERIPQLNSLGFVGFTDIDQMSSGGRGAMTWGKVNEMQLTVGADFRYLSGALNERDTAFGLTLPCFTEFNFPIPRAQQSDAGAVFADCVVPVTDAWTVKSGIRVDLLDADIGHLSPAECASAAQVLGTTDFNHEYALLLAYVTSDYKVNSNWTASAGFGHAERPPTLTELFAEGPFLAALQNGFTSVIGNPLLKPEKLNQVDVGVRGDYDWFHTGLNGYYAFINDYITYEADNLFKLSNIILPTALTPNGLTVRYTNTNWATLAGFEWYGDVDVTGNLTPYVNMSYVEGRDLTRDHRGRIGTTFVNNAGQVVNFIGTLGSPQEPLPGIAPMETRLGIRFHEDSKAPKWSTEFEARIVNSQDRFAESLGEERTGGFVIYNIRAYWQARKGVLLTAGVENLLDRFYREHLDLRTGAPVGYNAGGVGVFQPGINGYVGIELTY